MKLDEIIKNEIKCLVKEANWNFHYGKNHDGSPYYSENKYVCAHETGQFGSGTFFSTYRKENLPRPSDNETADHNFIQIGDGLYRVDFDFYENLYRVRSEKQGDLLHTMMGDLNGFYNKIHYGSTDLSVLYQRIAQNAKCLGLDCPKFMDLVRMAQKHDNKEDVQSFATLFMEKNGYNGVNVSGVDKFDNSRHGSVIYDLSKTHIKKVQGDFRAPMTVGYGHTKSVGVDDFDFEKSEKLSSLVGSLRHIDRNASEKEKLRLLKNIIYSYDRWWGDDFFDANMFEYYFGDSDKCMKYFFHCLYNGKIGSSYLGNYKIAELVYKYKRYEFLNFPITKYGSELYHITIDGFLRAYNAENNYDLTDEERKAYVEKLIPLVKRPFDEEEMELFEELGIE